MLKFVKKLLFCTRHSYESRLRFTATREPKETLEQFNARANLEAQIHFHQYEIVV